MKPDLWVVDTNVVVSGLTSAGKESPTRVILDWMRSRRIRFVLSEKLVSEYRQVSLRTHVERAIRMSAKDVDAFLKSLLASAIVLDIGEPKNPAPEPGDNHLWALLEAFAGKAGLITGDRLLHKHLPPVGLVITPRDWLNRFGAAL